MFSAILLMCSLETGKCMSVGPPQTFTSEQVCVDFADELRYRVMTQENNMAVDYRCINWGVGA
jgi:hypothetical protein